MVKNRGVSMVVDEDFFNMFEKERKIQQAKLRIKVGGVFNLTQRNFTAFLAKSNFRFKLPKRKSIKVLRINGRRRKK